MSTFRAGRGPVDGSRAVAIGGGHGLSRTLLALTQFVNHVTAVVATADDGGSSGRLRRDYGVVPPGDLRMALAALSTNEQLAELIQYRFAAGELEGHSLGNLILVALAELNGEDLVAALDQVSTLTGGRGRVLPCTTESVQLHALAGGREIKGQVKVAGTAHVDRVWLEPSEPPATAAATDAIARADLLVLGPGSLFTSLLPNLLVPGIAKAIMDARAPVVMVANLREQPGETESLTLTDHLSALAEHVPGLVVDWLVVHAGTAPAGPGRPLEVPTLVPGQVTALHATDLIDGHDGHHPLKLANALRTVHSQTR